MASSRSPGEPRPDLPRLIVPFHPTAVSPLRISKAAHDVWQPIWLVDRSLPNVSENTVRFLGRIGPMVETTGLSPAAVANLVRPLNPGGITAYSEGELMGAAEVAAELGLHFHSVAVANRLTDKRAQREALRSAGVTVPGYWSVPAGAGLARAAAVADQARYPAIVKPTAGSASRNTFRVDDRDDLLRVLRHVAATNVVVEEYLPDGWPRHERPYADYLSVESIVTDAGTRHFAVSGCTPLAEPFRETGAFAPSNLTSDLVDEVSALASAAITAIGIQIGAVHTEIKLTPDGPRIIEVNGRLGGGRSDLIELGSGCSLLGLASVAALGDDLREHPAPTFSVVSYDLEFQAPTWASRLKKLDGLDRLAAIPGVATVVRTRRDGERVDWRDGTDASSAFRIFGTVADHEALWKLHARIPMIVDLEFE